MNDIDQRCDAYLDWLDAQRRDRTPVLAQIAAMGAATSGIMGVAGAGTQAIAIVATAFGLAGTSYANWNSRLLLDVDHSTVQAVVYSRQQQYRESIYNIAVPNRASAIYFLRQYLRLCMPITIETQINTTATLVAKNAPEQVIKAPLVQAVAVSNVVTEVRKPLATPQHVGSEGPTIKLTPFEDLAGDKIQQIQRALCVASPSNDLGRLDSPARIAMSEFFQAAGFGPSQTIKNAKMLNKLQDAVSKVGARNAGGTCAKAGFDGPRAVGEAVKRPLITQPETTNKLTAIEAGLTGDKVQQIQRALCVASPSDDLGALDSEARKNMSEFFEAAGFEPSQTIKDAKMINKLEDAITKVGARSVGGTCAKAGFDSPRAVGEAVKKALNNQ
jgi:hypothetical protein